MTHIDRNLQDSLKLLTQIDAERAEADVTDGWKVAPFDAPRDVFRTPLAQLLDQVAWQMSHAKLPLRIADKPRAGCWFMKELTLPADRPRMPLVLELGPMAADGPPTAVSGMLWFNGEALGEPALACRSSHCARQGSSCRGKSVRRFAHVAPSLGFLGQGARDSIRHSGSHR